MKHLLFLLCLVSGFYLSGQTVTGISPNQSYQGQTLNTTITSSGLFVTSSSPQGNIQDIILKNATDSVFAVADSTVAIDANTATTVWNIPLSVASGVYNLVVRIYDMFSQTFSDFSLSNAFTITSSTATVTGTVFNDINRNGIQDSGELGLAGYTVKVKTIGNTAITDAAGNYSIGTVPGLDSVQLIRPADDIYANTTPGTTAINVQYGTNAGNNFGLVVSHFLTTVTPTSAIAGQTINMVIGDSMVTTGSTLISVVLHRQGYSNVYASTTSVPDSYHINATITIPQYYLPTKYDVVVTVRNTTTNAVRSYMIDTAISITGPKGMISGYVYTDVNNNGIKDAGDSAQAYTFVYLSGGSVYINATTDSNGYYRFINLPVGNYTLQVSNPYSYYGCGSLGSVVYTPAQYSSVTVNNDTTINKNFSSTVSTSANYNLYIHPGWRPANPGFLRHYWIFYGNHSNIPVANGVVTFQYDSTLTFDSCDRVPSSHNLATHTLTWNVGTIPPNSWIGGWNDFNLYMRVPVTAVAGSILHSVFTIDPQGGDCSTWDNVVIDATSVTSSMDPNEKHAVPASGLKFEQDSIINYTINFQNTGTASTHFVIVKDTLDQNLDPKTVIATGSSHPFKLDVNGRILTFTFDPVELTDSATDEPHSHGSISFMAKLKPNLPIGTVIRNFASIYFDYNTPVLTNTTVNTIVNPAGIQTAQIDNLRVTVTPNPFSTITTISFNNTAHDKFSFALYDIEGKVVRTLETNDATIELNRAALESGAYMYKLTNQRTAERIAGKIVIM